MKYIATLNGKKYEIELEKVSSGFVPMTRATVAAPVAPVAPARAFSTALLLCTSSLKRSLRSFCTRRTLSHFQLGFNQISE